jgi:hypothetical protein
VNTLKPGGGLGCPGRDSQIALVEAQDGSLRSSRRRDRHGGRGPQNAILRSSQPEHRPRPRSAEHASGSRRVTSAEGAPTRTQNFAAKSFRRPSRRTFRGRKTASPTENGPPTFPARPCGRHRAGIRLENEQPARYTPPVGRQLRPFVAYSDSFCLRPGIRRRGRGDHARSQAAALPALSRVGRRRYQLAGISRLFGCGNGLEKTAQAVDQARVEQNLVARDELVDPAAKGR